MDGGQLLTDGIDDEFMGRDAGGLAIGFNTLQQGLGDLQSRGFIRRNSRIFTHLHTHFHTRLNWMGSAGKLNETRKLG